MACNSRETRRTCQKTGQKEVIFQLLRSTCRAVSAFCVAGANLKELCVPNCRADRLGEDAGGQLRFA